jgi:hypothetical protein
MSHPLTSQISYKALFPSFVPPEDVTRGDHALRLAGVNGHILNSQAPSQPPPVQVVKKQSGNAYRHEIITQQLPTKRQGLHQPENEYYHV